MKSISWLHIPSSWLAVLTTRASLDMAAATSQQRSLQTVPSPDLAGYLEMPTSGLASTRVLLRTEAKGEPTGDQTSHSLGEDDKIRASVDNVGNVNPLVLTQTKEVNQQTLMDDADCVWEEWRDWSACQFTCGGGQAMRTRKVKIMAKNNGTCDNHMKETRECTNNDCPVDCVWEEWGNWTSCSTSCGAGTKTKNRKFKQVAAFGGLTCQGSTIQSTECTTGECPVDCQYGSWEGWGGCSVSCGGGSRKRYRPVTVSPNTVGKQCDLIGKNAEEAACGQNNCPVDCVLEDWTSWDLCDVSCGQGFTKRTRAIRGNGSSFGGQPCGAIFQNKSCDNGQCPVDCKLSDWSEWHACDVTCGAGKRKRSRVVAVAGNAVGAKCASDEPSRSQAESCNMNGCPIDCEMSDWTRWTGCSMTCGAGISERYRENKVHAEYGGRACHHNTTYEKKYCSSEACPVDCEWDPWQAWRDCSTTCGNGTSLRMRIVKTPVANGGQLCPGSSSQIRDCNLRFCPVHCQWSDWADWSSCSTTCAEGSRERTRKVAVQADYGGLTCKGNTRQAESCSGTPCPVHCAWKDWNEWISCSASCGQGQHSRTRSIGTEPSYGGEPCNGSAAETKECADLPDCPTDCEWDTWTDWAKCSKTCGEAITTRTRIRKQYEKAGGHTCWGTDKDQRDCNLDACPIDCVLGDWSNWGSCSKSCGDDAVHSRTRGIQVRPQFHGKECESSRNSSKSCELGPCPVDCVWAEWESWAECSKSCNGGMNSRTRSVKSAAMHGGRPCEGSSREDGACNFQGCPLDCEWQPWSEWGTCDKTCGGGVRKQSRKVKIDPLNGGRPCDTTNDQGGPAIEKSESCNDQPCPVDCAWSSWNAFSSCSKSCGVGSMYRTRVKQRVQTNGGVPCTGDATETNFCNTQGCPRNCQWGEWSQWTECSKRCDGGKTKRFRDIAVTRKNGGTQCPGLSYEEIDCNMNECPVNCLWGDWADWSSCPATCGSPMRLKTRPKKIQERNGGKPCDGSATETERCSFLPCPVDCKLQPWGDWSACSASCEGERFRSRVKAKEIQGGKPCDGEMEQKESCNKEGSQGCPTTKSTTMRPNSVNQTAQIDDAINHLNSSSSSKVGGSLILDVSDGDRFISDPAAKQALRQTTDQERSKDSAEGGLLESTAGYVRKHEPILKSAASSAFFSAVTAAAAVAIFVP